MDTVPSAEERFTKVLRDLVSEWPIDPDERDHALCSIEALGGVQFVRSTIGASSETPEFVSLAARDRLDLTPEALALCPAWKELFSDERAPALKRLGEARARWESWEIRPAKTMQEPWVFWMDGRPVSASHALEDAGSSSPTCDMFTRMAVRFEESGRFGASLSQRRHTAGIRQSPAACILREIEFLASERFVIGNEHP